MNTVTIWLWESDDEDPPPPYDVWLIGVRSPSKAFVTENLTFYVDIVNIGSNTDAVDVDIELKEYDGTSYNLISTNRVTLDQNEYNSSEFTWQTTTGNVTPLNNHYPTHSQGPPWRKNTHFHNTW